MTRVAPTPTLTDAALYAGDPYPTYAWLRANAPVYWDAVSQLWVCSRYDDVVRISKDPLTFSSAGGVLMDSDQQVSLVTTDAPRHTRLRKLVSRGFTPRMVAQYGQRIREIVTELLDRMAPRAQPIWRTISQCRCRSTSSPTCWAFAARLPARFPVVGRDDGSAGHFHDPVVMERAANASSRMARISRRSSRTGASILATTWSASSSARSRRESSRRTKRRWRTTRSSCS
jgi:hypothetical protein